MKRLTKKTSLTGTLTVPGDKSISHRALMLSSLAEGVSSIYGMGEGKDCLSTMDCLRRLGIRIEKKEDRILVHGRGLHGLRAPEGSLDAGNSGTTLRLLAGILAGQDFDSVIGGDLSLNSRPMERIIKPLTQMGAGIESMNGGGRAPLRISGGRLKGIRYDSPISSGQVKSCILLAGLYADGVTSVSEPRLSRDHTERMLPFFGVNVRRVGKTCSVEPPVNLRPVEYSVPGDISAAAYFLAAGLVVPDSSLLLKNVGINETRAGFLHACRLMGADLELKDIREACGEPAADIRVRTSELRGITIDGKLVPSLIDELPLLALLACHARGMTIIKDAGELRVKESDRIALVTENLKRMGADITGTEDGFIIRGGRPLHGAEISCGGDHRIAMTFAVAGISASGTTLITDSDCVAVSDPDFFTRLESLGKSV